MGRRGWRRPGRPRLGRRRLGRRCRWSTRAVPRGVRAGGRLIRFRRTDLDAYLTACAVPAVRRSRRPWPWPRSRYLDGSLLPEYL